MRILIITFYFPPYNAIASYRPYSWAKYWSEDGHDVTVLTTDKGRCDREIRENAHFRTIELDLGFAFRVWEEVRRRCYSKSSTSVSEPRVASVTNASGRDIVRRTIGRINSFLVRKGVLVGSRMPDLTDGWIRPAVRWAEDSGPWDLALSTYGPYTTHYIGMRIKKTKTARFWVADYRDLWTDNDIFPGLFPFTLFERFLERYSMKRADMITTVSAPLANVLSDKYGREKVKVIENGFDSSELRTLDHAPVFPNDGKVRIVYTGTIYRDKRDVTPFFHAISSLAEEPNKEALLGQLEVLFCGQGMSELENQIEKYGVSKWVKYLGFLPRETALRMQRDAHVLLFLDWNDNETEGIMTGKLFEYMASKTPIWSIGAREAAASRLIGKAGAGVYLGRDEARIKGALVSLLGKNERSRSRVDPEILAVYERKHLAKRLLHLIQERITGKNVS